MQYCLYGCGGIFQNTFSNYAICSISVKYFSHLDLHLECNTVFFTWTFFLNFFMNIFYGILFYLVFCILFLIFFWHFVSFWYFVKYDLACTSLSRAGLLLLLVFCFILVFCILSEHLCSVLAHTCLSRFCTSGIPKGIR